MIVILIYVFKDKILLIISEDIKNGSENTIRILYD